MAGLSIHAVQWCAHHGHPVLALRTESERYFVVAVSAEDGAALATMQDPNGSNAPARRLYRLLEATLRSLDAHVSEVHLHVGNDNLLRASLRLLGPGGEVELPANFADGVILAHRGNIPLRMGDEDMGRVPLAPLTPMGAPPEISPAEPPEVFRTLIESLDLEGLGDIHRSRDQPPPKPPA